METNTITIKRATEPDLNTIQELVHQIWKPTYHQILSEAQMDYMLNNMYNSLTLQQQLQSRHEMLLIYWDNNPQGFAAFEFDYEQKGTTKLHKLYMLPNQQGKGLGKKLLETVIMNAKQANQQQLMLNVNRANKAIHFYEKMGFTITEIVDIEIGQGYYMNDYIMLKMLT